MPLQRLGMGQSAEASDEVVISKVRLTKRHARLALDRVFVNPVIQGGAIQRTVLPRLLWQPQDDEMPHILMRSDPFCLCRGRTRDLPIKVKSE